MSFVLEQTCLMVYLEISHLSAIFLAKFSYLRGHFADIRLLYPSSVSAAVSHLCPGTITFAILWIFILVSIGASASQYDSMTVFGDFFKYISRAYIFHYTYLRIFPDTSAPRVHWQEVSKYSVTLVATRAAAGPQMLRCQRWWWWYRWGRQRGRQLYQLFRLAKEVKYMYCKACLNCIWEKFSNRARSVKIQWSHPFLSC